MSHSLDSCGLLVATEHRLLSQPLQTPAAPIKSSGGAQNQMIGSASRGFSGCVQSGAGDEMLHFWATWSVMRVKCGVLNSVRHELFLASEMLRIPSQALRTVERLKVDF